MSERVKDKFQEIFWRQVDANFFSAPEICVHSRPSAVKKIRRHQFSQSSAQIFDYTLREPAANLLPMKTKRRFFNAVLLATVLALAGCQSGVTNIPVSPNSETGQAIRKMDFMQAHGGLNPDDEPAYREVAEHFIQSARAGDVPQMLALTSPQSYATQTDSVHTVYADQVVPAFHDTTVIWNSKATPCQDEQHHWGYMFTGMAHGKKNYTFDVAVYKENGHLVVANIRSRH